MSSIENLFPVPGLCLCLSLCLCGKRVNRRQILWQEPSRDPTREALCGFIAVHTEEDDSLLTVWTDDDGDEMTDDGDEHDGIDPKQIFMNENICNYQWAMNAGEGETET